MKRISIEIEDVNVRELFNGFCKRNNCTMKDMIVKHIMNDILTSYLKRDMVLQCIQDYINVKKGELVIVDNIIEGFVVISNNINNLTNNISNMIVFDYFKVIDIFKYVGKTNKLKFKNNFLGYKKGDIIKISKIIPECNEFHLSNGDVIDYKTLVTNFDIIKYKKL